MQGKWLLAQFTALIKLDEECVGLYVWAVSPYVKFYQIETTSGKIYLTLLNFSNFARWSGETTGSYIHCDHFDKRETEQWEAQNRGLWRRHEISMRHFHLPGGGVLERQLDL